MTNPLSWNRYSYALYNPLNRTDPTEEMPCAPGTSQCRTGKAATTAGTPATTPQAAQQTANAVAGSTTVGALAKTMSNEDSSVSGDARDELEKGKNALANAIINNALLQHPAKVAPPTGVATKQDAHIMGAALENRFNGGADPVNGRTQYGFTHNPGVKWRSAGNHFKGTAGRETMYMKFVPFSDSLNSKPMWIVIYNDPGH